MTDAGTQDQGQPASDVELRRLAEEARCKLPELIPDPGQREPVDRALAAALAEPPGPARAALVTALRSHEALLRWLAVDRDRGPGTLGNPTESIGVLYICPRQDYSVVPDVPPKGPLFCPHDDSILERHDD